MADFKLAQKFVSQAEGGYTDNPLDNGNWTGGLQDTGTLIGTNHGISAPTLCEWLGKIATKQDMLNLPYSVALEIYKKNYWDILNLTEITNQSVALLIYDGAVNQGVSKLKLYIVSTLNMMGIKAIKSEPVAKLTPKINQCDQEQFFNLLKTLRKAAYSQSSSFYAGWMKRLNKLKFKI